ncbi:phage holin [Carnobacteriaceae bacterium zg-ZUI252]|nr:phage holin [Carnobacteriaceae bacterium zg-ZUI252]MBS4769672.1 phage holin [Carnobacteriaceae bacterium zg-ZUI240]
MEQITQSFITLLGSIFTALVAYSVKALKDYLTLKGGEKAVKISEILAFNAVQTVEQVTAQMDVRSTDKLKEARRLVLQGLREHGVEVSADQLDMYIESAVKQANEIWKSKS